MRHGDPLSPNLFNCVLEDIFREIDSEGRGIKIDGEYLSNLWFVDNVVMVAKSTEELREMAEEFIGNSKKAGLILNGVKIKILTNRKIRKMVKGREDTEGVEEVEY